MNKFRSVVLIFIAFIFLFIPLQVFAQDKQRIFDEANILTESEVEKLESLAEEASEKQKADFVILTTDGEHGIDLEAYMDDFTEEQQIGYDPVEGNAVLLGIDLKESDVMIMGFEKGKERVDNDRAAQIREKITPYLSDENFFTAFEIFITTTERYMRYRPGVDPDNIMFKTSWQIAFAVLLGAIITFIMVRNINPKVTTTPATYRNDQLTRILRRRDRYVRTSVTKSYRPRNNNRGGGSGGGRRGRSSYGRTRSGRSYSGSRGKF